MNRAEELRRLHHGPILATHEKPAKERASLVEGWVRLVAETQTRPKREAAGVWRPRRCRLPVAGDRGTAEEGCGQKASDDQVGRAVGAVRGFPVRLSRRRCGESLGPQDSRGYCRPVRDPDDEDGGLRVPPQLNRIRGSGTTVRAELAKRIEGPVNVLATTGTPPVSELEALGVARVTFGSGLTRAAYGAAVRAVHEALSDGTYCWLEGAVPHPELSRKLEASATITAASRGGAVR